MIRPTRPRVSCATLRGRGGAASEHPHVRPQRRGLGAARRRRPAPPGTAGAAERLARDLLAGVAAHLRLREHPLHDLDPHRDLGDGQADPVRAAAAGRRAGGVGLRLGRPAPPALQPVAGRRRKRARAGGSPRCAEPSTRTPRSPRTSRGRSPTVLREHGLEGEPVGVDVVEMPVLAALRAEGLDVVDGQQVFLEARRIKTADEISLLTQACAMVDAAYDELYAFLRPGVRENECVGLVAKVLYDLGSEYVEGVNAISGERCSPHPHVYCDRVIRPGDPAFFDILHSHLGYRTCYYRMFAVGSASPRMRDAYVALPGVHGPGDRPGAARRHHRRHRRRCGRRRRSSASPTRRRRSRCSTATASACPSGRSRSSPGWSRSSTRRSSRRGWCSRWRPTGPRPTAGARPHRGGGGGHRRRLRGDHQVPRRGPAGRRPAVLDGRRRAGHAARRPVAPEHAGRTGRAEA